MHNHVDSKPTLPEELFHSMSTTKSRIFKPRKYSGREFEVYNDDGSLESENEIGGTYSGAQVTVSEDHDWPPPSGKFTHDRGGDFFTTKTYFEPIKGKIKARGNTNIGLSGARKRTEWYQGNCFTVPDTFGTGLFPQSVHSSNEQLDALGATAVARCKPTNSAIDFGVFAGELLREGIPRFGPSANWRERTRAAKAAGNDYLNAQFGWKPLVSELQNFGDNVGKTYTALEQLRRDDGRLVHRSYSFDETYEVTELTRSNGTGHWPSLYSAFWQTSSGAKRLLKVETSKRQWFSGAFRYNLPESLKDDSRLGDLRALIEHSLGLSLTPELVWNLTPWSWAVDWFSNAGDVISNISDHQKYGLIMPYGYMMEHSIKKYTYSTVGLTFKPNGSKPTNLVLVRETKVRRKAHPFGFGVSDGDLNPEQISILTALGLSRS